MTVKQKVIYSFGSILIIVAVLLFAWLPEYVEKSRNRVIPSQNVEISSAENTFHQSLFIADLHSDSLLWNRNLAKKSTIGHVDIPRLIEGNVGLQVFAVGQKPIPIIPPEAATFLICLSLKFLVDLAEQTPCTPV